MADEKKKIVEFANFQGTLGMEIGLTSYLPEILVPAFTDDKIFLDPKLLPFYLLDVTLSKSTVNGQPSMALCGRFLIKKRFIKSQDYDPGTKRRKKAHGVLEDFPSAIFWLDLTTHHLVYLKETPFAPTLKNFELASNHCLRAARRRFLEKRAEKEHPKKYGRATHLSLLNKEFPDVAVEIVPFHSKDLLEQAFSIIDKLKRIDLNFVPDNATRLNLRPLQKHILDVQSRITDESTTKHSLAFSAVGKDASLDKEETKVLLDEIAGKGYGTYKFKGKDKESKDVTGDSKENVSLRDHLEINTEEPIGFISKLLNKLYTKQAIPNNTSIELKGTSDIAMMLETVQKKEAEPGK
jgi:hypothetical protein